MQKLAAALALALVLSGCASDSGPQSGSQTNWLRTCEAADECGGLECICGVCTRACSAAAACGELPGASCIAEQDPGAIALCSGQAPPSAVCLPRCDPGSCAAGTHCVANLCMPTVPPSAEVAVDASATRQSLIGFGASVAFSDDAIVANADKDTLFDFAFTEAGLDVIRLRNRYENGDEDLVASKEIADAAAERLGRPVVVFMTSSTPPEALKANGSRTCSADPATCTLASVAGGGFAYDGFADYWRSALEAYATLGINPDYVSIQSHPSWVPPVEVSLEACAFLPEEGTTTVTVDGAPLEVAYPGYLEALGAVKRALVGLPTQPKLAGPETGVIGFGEFAAALTAADVDALAFQAYGVDAAVTDLTPLAQIGARAQELGHPLLQTEMQSEGLDTAVLIHQAMVGAGAAAYLQNDLVGGSADVAGLALVLMTDTELERQPTYYSFLHYAQSTQPGWVRVDAPNDSPVLLSSAWLAPEGTALTVVLVNPGTRTIDAELPLAPSLRSRLSQSSVSRTVFGGLERAAPLGELPAGGVVRVPGGAIVTVALSQD